MPLLLEPLTKLFNLIFMKGTFPKAWNESFIVLIHKKGNKSDSSNYRGISITSNLGTDHLTCRGEGYGFFCSEFFLLRTTPELEYSFFFVPQSANFFQNLTLGYMTKTLNQIIFFLPPKSESFFQQHWKSEYFFRKKP